MRIRLQGEQDKAIEEQQALHLCRLLEQPTDKELRPCAGCSAECPCTLRSPTCCCGCSAQCPLASTELSFDPDGYPIEPGVVSLVYEIAALRVLPTCWSCEGHCDENAKLHRLPQVWFYSESVVYLELVADYLSDLLFEKRLKHPWIVVSLPRSDEVSLPRFSIRPDLRAMEDSELQVLQEDLHVLAEGLGPTLRRMAQRRLSALRP